MEQNPCLTATAKLFDRSINLAHSLDQNEGVDDTADADRDNSYLGVTYTRWLYHTVMMGLSLNGMKVCMAPPAEETADFNEFDPNGDTEFTQLQNEDEFSTSESEPIETSAEEEEEKPRGARWWLVTTLSLLRNVMVTRSGIKTADEEIDTGRQFWAGVWASDSIWNSVQFVQTVEEIL